MFTVLEWVAAYLSTYFTWLWSSFCPLGWMLLFNLLSVISTTIYLDCWKFIPLGCIGNKKSERREGIGNELRLCILWGTETFHPGWVRPAAAAAALPKSIDSYAFTVVLALLVAYPAWRGLLWGGIWWWWFVPWNLLATPNLTKTLLTLFVLDFSALVSVFASSGPLFSEIVYVVGVLRPGLDISMLLMLPWVLDPVSSRDKTTPTTQNVRALSFWSESFGFVCVESFHRLLFNQRFFNLPTFWPLFSIKFGLWFLTFCLVWSLPCVGDPLSVFKWLDPNKAGSRYGALVSSTLRPFINHLVRWF